MRLLNLGDLGLFCLVAADKANILQHDFTDQVPLFEVMVMNFLIATNSSRACDTRGLNKQYVANRVRAKPHLRASAHDEPG